MNNNIIRLTEINERKYLLEDTKRSIVKPSQFKMALNESDFVSMDYFINQISKTSVDSDRYIIDVLETVQNTDNITDTQKDTLYKKISRNVLPKVTPDTIKKLGALEDMEKYNPNKASSSFMNSDVIKDKISDIIIIDRVLKNNESLSKRFNIDKVIKNSSSKDTEDLVNELCALIDTYILPIESKYNIALENVIYSLNKNHIRESNAKLTDIITNYFIENNLILTDKDISGIVKILETNRFLDVSDDSYINYLKESYDKSSGRYTKKIDALSKKCKDKEISKLILNAKTIKNEKQASIYINRAVKAVYNLDMSLTDRQNIMTSIFLIPLIGNVSKAFVNSELRILETKYNFQSKIEDEKYIDMMKTVLDDEDDLMVNAILGESIQLESDTFEIYKKKEMDYSFAFLESETIPESSDIKDLLNKFKSDQEKSVNRFRICLTKIYKKSPQNIIDNTPNILSLIRVVFVLGTFTIPVIGPIVALLAAFIDHILSSSINEREVKKLITAIKDEKELVEKKIKKNDNNKAELEKYLHSLNMSLEKCKAYRDSLSDDIDEDELDDFDFELEASKFFYKSQIFNELAEAQQDEDFKIQVEQVIPKKLIKYNKDLYNDYITMVEMSGIFNKENIMHYLKGNVTMTINESTFVTTTHIKNMCIGSDNEDIAMIESYNALNGLKEIVKSITVNTNESSPFVTVNEATINMNTLKLAIQNFKGKLKDLSTKEKAAWQSLDASMSGFMKAIEKSMTSNRREAIIRGSIIPSFSKCLKTAIVIGAATFINPIGGLITALGMFGTSKYLNNKERQLIYDEIETELKVIDKQIQLADNDGDMRQYRFLLQYQKKLQRERQRIKYGLKVHGRDIPSVGSRED